MQTKSWKEWIVVECGNGRVGPYFLVKSAAEGYRDTLLQQRSAWTKLLDWLARMPPKYQVVEVETWGWAEQEGQGA